jgi:hypothetical protein
MATEQYSKRRVLKLLQQVAKLVEQCVQSEGNNLKGLLFITVYTS